MAKSQKYLDRCARIRKAVAFEAPDKVPYSANWWSWRFMDAGFTYEEATHDNEKVLAANQHVMDTYPLDGIIMTGFRNPLRVTESLDASRYTFDAPNKLRTEDHPIFGPEVYAELGENFMQALWEKVFAAKCAPMKGMTPQEFAQRSLEFAALVDAAGRATEALQEGGLPAIWVSDYAFVGYEIIFNFLRGIKETSMDVRRYKKEMLSAINSLDRVFIDPLVAKLNSTEGPDMTEPFDCATGWLGHTVLNPKQFEEIYWPSFKPMLDACAEQHKTMMIFAEGNWTRLAKFLAPYPKGTAAIYCELDDIIEARQAAPNVCLIGGLDINAMGNGTPEECVAMAKRVIDETGAKEGGVILSENKMCSYPGDTKRENVLAVLEFLETY